MWKQWIPNVQHTENDRADGTRWITMVMLAAVMSSMHYFSIIILFNIFLQIRQVVSTAEAAKAGLYIIRFYSKQAGPLQARGKLNGWKTNVRG